PHARQLLWQWYVDTCLKKQCSLLGDMDQGATMKPKGIMKVLLETLGDDGTTIPCRSFMEHWDSNIDEWVMFKRGGVPHLVKEIAKGTFTIDEHLPMRITLQYYAEERYLAEMHCVRSRPPTSTCNCVFVQTCLLPCQYVMYVRRKADYETSIPPMCTSLPR
ncbi:hypothetical protein PHMEG_00013102, partial [Phytophthora megakarya]